MAKTYIHVMQMTLYSENLNYAEAAQWQKPISMLCKYRFIAKTYIHVVQMSLYSENLNHEEVARR